MPTKKQLAAARARRGILSKPAVKATTHGQKVPQVDWAPAYLAALAVTGQKTKAARDAKTDYAAVFRRRETDPDFALAEVRAIRCANDVMESEAVRRAVEGCTRRHYDKNGTLRYEEVVYSDMLLLRALERADPTWRTKTHLDVTSGGKSVFATRAERKRAVEEAKANAQKPLS